MNEDQPFVKVEDDRGISWVTFYHPQHNSLPGDLLKQLCKVFEELGDSSSCHAIVLRAAGDRTFCAGANLTELASIESEDRATEFFQGFGKVILAMRTCPKLIIGRVQGKTVGGGVGLASGVDYCMATKWASVKLSEVSLGIGPFVISNAVKRKIGLSAFSALAINSSEWKTAEWARDRGLFQELFDSTEHLDDYLDRFLDTIRTYSPEALSALKNNLWEGTEAWEEQMQEHARTSGRLLLTQAAQNNIKNVLSKTTT